jgi:hypothetical protein
MRDIRTVARQESANVPYTFTGIIGGSRARGYQRREIRYHKEASLRPHEDERSAIERQIIEIEKDIFWDERFS